ncbi:hypothetical protein J4Q44_G00318310 [Coregonus suidteri]|uniref:Uncharacterized protein n=1 Tax=Coregonus suidteri TaxID=861788 RepID=A0AAN8KSL7_9TELE
MEKFLTVNRIWVMECKLQSPQLYSVKRILSEWTVCHRGFPEQQKLQQRQKGKWQKCHGLFQGTAGKWRWNSCSRDGQGIANRLSKRLAMVGSSIKKNVKDYTLRRQGLSSQLPQTLVYEDAVQVDSAFT